MVLPSLNYRIKNLKGLQEFLESKESTETGGIIMSGANVSIPYLVFLKIPEIEEFLEKVNPMTRPVMLG